jgi:hypothetical protein
MTDETHLQSLAKSGMIPSAQRARTNVANASDKDYGQKHCKQCCAKPAVKYQFSAALQSQELRVESPEPIRRWLSTLRSPLSAPEGWPKIVVELMFTIR